MKEKPKHTFKAPEGYFESFNERLKQRLDDEIETESHIIPKTDGFAVPEGYFDLLKAETFKGGDNSGAKVVSLKSYRTFYYAAAAIAAIFVLVFEWNNNQQVVEFDDLANAEITAYFESEDFELSSYEIAEVLPVENLSFNDITETPLEEDTVLEYLEETVEDLEELNLEYDELDE
ncbi:hypothetical protein [Allomuricauda sp. d1]|uniref:hypothetical protein n=1 Tax=Allomuricauda sp. d1 TaxID=3136725 RepID=UPI0031D3AC0A